MATTSRALEMAASSHFEVFFGLQSIEIAKRISIARKAGPSPLQRVAPYLGTTLT